MQVREQPVSQEAVAAASVPALFEATRKRVPDAPALFFRSGDRWVSISWKDYGSAVGRFGNFLLSEGVQPQQRIAIWASNRPEWQVADLGIMEAGAVSVAVYQTLASDQVRYLLEHSESVVVVAESPKMVDAIRSMRETLPGLRRVVLLEGDVPGLEGWVITWEAALKKGEDFQRVRPGLLNSRIEALRPDEMASLIYTSGTTGTPKAAVLTQRNLTWLALTTLEALPGSPDDRILSYLPLAHVLERVVSHLRQLCTGCQVYFCPSVDQVMPMLREVRPTYFTSVPRLWEKIYAGVRARMDKVTGPKRLVRDWALKVGALKTQAYERGRQPSRLVASQWALADRLVFRNIREQLGLDKVRICISGSAPVSPDILRFFYGLGIEILEGYGLTETTAPATVNRPGRARFGTVGPALPGVDIKIAPDGEILVKGPNVFAGYLKDSKTTAETLKDGWLLTGDIGELDQDGYLKITDRKKDLFKTSGGKYVAPGAIENALRRCRGIGQAVVLGEGRPFVSALITLDPEALHGRRSKDDAEARRLVDEAIGHVNQGLSHPEQVKKWTILEGDFVVGDELTPTLKVRRKRISEKYASEIEALYADKKIA